MKILLLFLLTFFISRLGGKETPQRITITNSTDLRNLSSQVDFAPRSYGKSFDVPRNGIPPPPSGNFTERMFRDEYEYFESLKRRNWSKIDNPDFDYEYYDSIDRVSNLTKNDFDYGFFETLRGTNRSKPEPYPDYIERLNKLRHLVETCDCPFFQCAAAFGQPRSDSKSVPISKAESPCPPGYVGDGEDCKRDPCAAVRCPAYTECAVRSRGNVTQTSCECIRGFVRNLEGQCVADPCTRNETECDPSVSRCVFDQAAFTKRCICKDPRQKITGICEMDKRNKYLAHLRDLLSCIQARQAPSIAASPTNSTPVCTCPPGEALTADGCAKTTQASLSIRITQICNSTLTFDSALEDEKSLEFKAMSELIALTTSAALKEAAVAKGTCVKKTPMRPGSVILDLLVDCSSHQVFQCISDQSCTSNNVNSALASSDMMNVDTGGISAVSCFPSNNDCDQNAVCIERDLLYTCQCREGFVDQRPETPGRMCLPEDYCAHIRVREACIPAWMVMGVISSTIACILLLFLVIYLCVRWNQDWQDHKLKLRPKQSNVVVPVVPPYTNGYDPVQRHWENHPEDFAAVRPTSSVHVGRPPVFMGE